LPLAHSDELQVAIPPQPSEAVPPHWLPQAAAAGVGVQHAFW
jgi:hypothetical protein